jgi:hypothetical protein
VERHWPLHAAKTTLTVIGELEFTSCTAVGGSRDRTTGGRELCAGLKQADAVSVLSVRLVIWQRGVRGAPSCLSIRDPTPDLVVTINAATHHAVVRIVRRVTVYRRPRCAQELALWLRVRAREGASAVSNAPNSQLIVVPTAIP